MVRNVLIPMRATFLTFYRPRLGVLFPDNPRVKTFHFNQMSFMCYHYVSSLISFKFMSLFFYWHPICFTWDHLLYLHLICLYMWLVYLNFPLNLFDTYLTNKWIFYLQMWRTYSGAHLITDTEIKAALLVHWIIYSRELGKLGPLVFKGIIQEAVIGAEDERRWES